MEFVQKYGGSSVATTEQIANIASFVKDLYIKGHRIVIVASAMGKTTNNLISLAGELSSSPEKREVDMLLSTGEQQTVSLLATALSSISVPAVSLTGAQAGIKTNKNYSKAFIRRINIKRVQKHLDEGKVVVVAGFQGIASNGDITTLGRGGSDTTAVAIAAALGWPCEIYTDVESVCTIDPRLYPAAKKLHSITFDEMMEMAVSGAKVLEPRSVELAKKYNVSLYLGKTLEKNKNKGTFVMHKTNKFEDMAIKNLSIKDEIGAVYVSVPTNEREAISKLIKIIGESQANYEMLCQIEKEEEIVFSFAVPLTLADSLLEKIWSEKISNEIKISVSRALSKVVLVGMGMVTHPDIASRLFIVLAKNHIEIHNFSLSEISISFTIDTEDKSKTIEVVAKEFDL